jgi:hypothetical protein
MAGNAGTIKLVGLDYISHQDAKPVRERPAKDL